MQNDSTEAERAGDFLLTGSIESILSNIYFLKTVVSSIEDEEDFKLSIQYPRGMGGDQFRDTDNVYEKTHSQESDYDNNGSYEQNESQESD